MKTPLYKLQARALLGDAEAKTECALTYARGAHLWPSERYVKQLVTAWLRGFDGAEDPYRYGRGGNFVAGLRRAHSAGLILRRELETMRGQDRRLFDAFAGKEAAP